MANAAASEGPANAGALAGSLSDDDIYDALSNQMPEQDLIDLLQKNGVSFHCVKTSRSYPGISYR